MPLFQRQAMMRAQAERREELRPLREAIDAAIEQLKHQGVPFRRIRPVIEATIGVEVKSQRGRWWGSVGKRNGPKLLAALQAIPRQERMFLR